jgi:hypothetical protein
VYKHTPFTVNSKPNSIQNMITIRNKEKRISFSKYDIEHLYNMAYENFEKDCIECQSMKKRIEKFLGKRIIKEILEHNCEYELKKP